MSLFSKILILGSFATSVAAQTFGDASETVVIGSESLFAANPTATAVLGGPSPFFSVGGENTNVQVQSDTGAAIPALTSALNPVLSTAPMNPAISTDGGATESGSPINVVPETTSSLVVTTSPVASVPSSSVDPGNVVTSTSTAEVPAQPTITPTGIHAGGPEVAPDPVGASSTSIIPGTASSPSMVTTASGVSSVLSTSQSTASTHPGHQPNIAQTGELTSSAQPQAQSPSAASTEQSISSSPAVPSTSPDPSLSASATQTAPALPTSATPEVQNADSSLSDMQSSSLPSSVVVNGLFLGGSSSVSSPAGPTPAITDGASTAAQTQATDHAQDSLTGTPEAQGNVIATPSSGSAQTSDNPSSTNSVSQTVVHSQDQATQTPAPPLISGTATSDLHDATTSGSAQTTGSALQSGVDSADPDVASSSGASQTAAPGDTNQVVTSGASETASFGSTNSVSVSTAITLASASASSSDPGSSNILSGSSISTSATATSRSPNRIMAQPTTTAPSLPTSLTIFTSGGSIFTVPLSSVQQSTTFTSGGSTFTVPFSSMSSSTDASDALSLLSTFSTGTLTGTNSATAINGGILSSATSTATGAANNGTVPAGTGNTPTPVIIGATIGSVMAAALSAVAIIVFCIRHKHKRNGRQLSTDELPIAISSQFPSRTGSRRASHWSASSRATTLARDVELDGDHNGSEPDYDDGEVRQLHQRGCLAQLQRIFRQIFELETVERPQELETVEKPQELEGDTVTCMVAMQAFLWRLLGRDAHEFKEVENIDYMDDLKKPRQWQLPSQRTSFTAAASDADVARDLKRQGKLKVATDAANDSASATDFIQEIKDQNRLGRAELDSRRASIVSPMTEPRTGQGSTVSPYLGRSRSLVSPFPELGSQQRSIVEASPELRGPGPVADPTPDLKSQQGSQRSAMTTSSKKSDGEETQTYQELQDFMDWLNKRRSDPDA